jgi:hypothetical protein
MKHLCRFSVAPFATLRHAEIILRLSYIRRMSGLVLAITVIYDLRAELCGQALIGVRGMLEGVSA